MHFRACSEPGSGPGHRVSEGRDVVRRNEKAEALLESLPIKFKKRMRNMIEDYEQERVEFIRRVADLEHRLLPNADVQRPQTCAGKHSTHPNDECVEIKQLLQDLYGEEGAKQNQIQQAGVQVLSSGIRDLKCKLRHNEQQIEHLTAEIAKFKDRHELQIPTIKISPTLQASPDPSDPSESQFSQFSLQTQQSQQRLLAAQPRLLPHRDRSPTLSKPGLRHWTDSDRSAPGNPRRSRSKTSYPVVEEFSEAEEQDFGKEKVVEKRRVRKLLKTIMSTT